MNSANGKKGAVFSILFNFDQLSLTKFSQYTHSESHRQK